ncbi:MAG: ATP-binding cassette domain-containing protein, partial [Actinomycetota bacterium]|nr:ATP-binding cassette domain-containing protein [Actinomycetota bacterium]
MLQVRDLSVEVGGRLTLEGASFTVATGDKVGLVGRNGAGKTTMLGVLAGHTPAHSGQAVRRGALGYLSQDPRSVRSSTDEGLSALDHVLSGRGLDQLAVTIEKRRLALEEDPSERNVARHAKAVDAFELVGGWSADSEVRRIAAGLGLPDESL